MEVIPITFEYQGRKIDGVLNNVSGWGSSGLFHLMIDNYYAGQLFYASEWTFSSNRGLFSGMSEQFGHHIVAWTDSSE